jgi:Tol biopolymer transport system component
MLHKRLITGLIAVVLSISLSGCFDLFGLPNTSVSGNGEWIAVIDGSFIDEESSLIAINVNTQETVTIDIEGQEEIAFDWHPDGQQLAFYSSITDDDGDVGSASLSLVNVDAPTEFTTIVEDLGELFVTQLAFSPDGSQLAFSALSGPTELEISTTPDLESGDEDTAEPLELSSALYVVDIESGEVTQLTDENELFVSVIDWSPDSEKIAFTAWNDGNADGTIDFSGAGLEDFPGDIVSVYYYDTASDSVNRVTTDASLGLSPSWLNDNTIVYSELSVMGLASESPDALSISAYDVDAQASRVIASGSDIGTGTFAVSASPMGDRIAFVGLELDAEGAAGIAPDDGEEAPPQPGFVFVMDADGSNIQQVLEVPAPEGIDGDVLLDTPVWSNDGETLYITAGNPLSGFGNIFSAGFEDESAPQPEAIPVYAVDIATPGEATVLYENAISSAGLVQAFATFAIFAGEAFSE